MAGHQDQTAITNLCRITWRTVGRICDRVVDDVLDPGRLDELFVIGVDEISCAPRGAAVPCGDERAPRLVLAGTG